MSGRLIHDTKYSTGIIVIQFYTGIYHTVLAICYTPIFLNTHLLQLFIRVIFFTHYLSLHQRLCFCFCWSSFSWMWHGRQYEYGPTAPNLWRISLSSDYTYDMKFSLVTLSHYKNMFQIQHSFLDVLSLLPFFCQNNSLYHIGCFFVRYGDSNLGTLSSSLVQQLSWLTKS